MKEKCLATIFSIVLSPSIVSKIFRNWIEIVVKHNRHVIGLQLFCVSDSVFVETFDAAVSSNSMLLEPGQSILVFRFVFIVKRL